MEGEREIEMKSYQEDGVLDSMDDGDMGEENLFKVLVIGDYAVGKTSIIRRYTEGIFSAHYKLTIGIDFAVKRVKLSEDRMVTLQLWDVAGHERFGTMTRLYYKYAIAGIVVFDMTRKPTLEAVTKWRDDVHDKAVLPSGEKIPLLLLANKCDLPDIEVTDAYLDEFVKAEGFIGWYATSALSNVHIDEAMQFLIQRIVQLSDQLDRMASEDAFTLPSTQHALHQYKLEEDHKSSGCCYSFYSYSITSLLLRDLGR